MLVRYVRKVIFKKRFVFVYNFQKWKPGNNGKTGKICKKGKIKKQISFIYKVGTR